MEKGSQTGVTWYKWKGNIVLSGTITALTGISIFAGDDPVQIGGVDKRVIRLLTTLAEIPYIPGSSLKGALRHCVERLDGKYKNDNFYKKIGEYYKHECTDDKCVTCRLMGVSAGAGRTPCEGLLKVRDSYLNFKSIQKSEPYLPRSYCEIKNENTIDRLSGQANPRKFERVPALSEFEFSAVLSVDKEDDVDLLKKLFKAMALLEDMGIGACKSRGYGTIAFGNFDLTNEKERMKFLLYPFDKEPIEGIKLQVRNSSFYGNREAKEVKVLIRKREGGGEHKPWEEAIQEVKKAIFKNEQKVA